MKNRQTANLVLSLVFIAFLGSLGLSYYYQQVLAIKLLRFVLEAALIGGIADWFAVTALFRKPLGFAYHTALVPRNRVKVIQAIAHMVESELLNPELITAKLSELKLIPQLITWGKAQAQQERLQEALRQALPKFSGQLTPENLTSYLEAQLKAYLGTIPVAPLLSRQIGQLLTDAKWQTELLADLTQRAALPSTRSKIYSFLSVRKAGLPKLLDLLLEKTNTLNLTEATDSLHLELVATLEQLQANPQHPIRLELAEMPGRLWEQLNQRQLWQETVEAWKVQLLAQLSLQEILEPVELSTHLASTAAQELQHYLAKLEQDQAFQDWLELQVLGALSNLIKSEHHLIGSIVRETLEGLTDEKLNDFIESKAGNDLQWIRINGSVVGGLIGLLLFLFLNLLYDPYVLPVISAWFSP